MKFILSSSGPDIDISSSPTFTCVELTRKKELGEPVRISQEELCKRLARGEEFRVLYKVGCRWEMGEALTEDSL